MSLQNIGLHRKDNEAAPLLVIVGETASGKSRLAMDVAQELRGEIISADSRMIYRGMDIGTAKPSGRDRALVKHHLIDIVYPDEHFSVVMFKSKALEAIKDIRNRGNVPIMVGGTGLYIDSVVYDYSFKKKYGAKINKKLESMTLDELRKLCIELGFGWVCEDKNRRRLINVISRGESLHDDRNDIIDNVILVGLKLDKNELRKRIQSRVEKMFRKGLRREVERLANKYGWNKEALTAIGYKEFEPYFQGKTSMSAVKRKIIEHTIQYAKRQRTWFKRNPNVKWFSCPDKAKRYILLSYGKEN